MSNRLIAARLGAAFAILVGILGGVGWLAVHRMGRLNADGQEQIRQHWEKVQMASQALEYSNLNSRITVQILLIKDRQITDGLLRQRADNSWQISQLCQQLEVRAESPKEKLLLQRVRDTRTPYVASYQRNLDLFRQSNNPHVAWQLMIDETFPLLLRYHDAWADFTQFQRQELVRRMNENQVKYSAAQNLATWLIGLGAFLAIGMAAWVTRDMLTEANRRQHAEDEVRKLNESLEEKVAERTAALDQSNQQLAQEAMERRWAEQAVRQSEERYRRLVSNIPDVTWTADENGHISYISPNVETVFGCSAEHVCQTGGMSWLLAGIHPEDSVRVMHSYHALFASGQAFDEEYRIQKNDGCWIWIHNRAMHTYREGGAQCAAGIFSDGVVSDITRRKNAEEELRSKTAFLEAQANSTIDGILVVDQDGQRILQNHRLAELLKVPDSILAEKDDRPLLQHVTAAMRDPQQFLRKVTYLYDHPEETSRDEIELKDGTILDRYSSPVVGKDGKYYGRIWIFRDLTERKRNEDRLRQLSLAVEQSPVSVVITDPDGNITYVNRRFTQCTGYSPEEVLGHTPRILKSGNISSEVYRNLWETITQGAEWHGELCNRKKNGDLYWESATISPITSPKGAITHFLAIKEDITERKSIESQLRQAQKLEAIGQLAAGIAHEINTPTQFVTDNLTFLKDSFNSRDALLQEYRKAIGNSPDPALRAKFEQAERDLDYEFLGKEIPRAIEQALDGARRVAKIVRAMKEFSHPDSSEKAAADLNKAIETTITVARNEWKYVADIETHFDDALPPVVCHVGDINQVVLNLIVNAAHAIKEKIQEGEKGRITISTRCLGESAEIAVTDTGAGIPESIRSRVFDPFFTTKEVGKGTGQGLTLAHTVVVKKHGGRIWFETEPGLGTTFFLQLPIQPTPVSQEA